MRTNLVRLLLLSLGFVSLALGILGIFLPLLPTTPFLLLSAWLFYRSSSKAYAWLLNHKIVGNYIRSFREQKAIPLHAKIISVAMLSATMAYSIIYVASLIWLKILLGAIACGVAIHILSYKTLRKEQAPCANKRE